MSQHTPGTLVVWENPYESNRFNIIRDGNWLWSILHNGEQLVDVQRVNMRRLVACWNACEDEDTAMLEAIVREGTTIRRRHDEALEWKEQYQSELCDMERQRDELLAALKLAHNTLRYAASDIADWGAYASEYFQKKHDLAGDIQAYTNAATHALEMITKVEGGAA